MRFILLIFTALPIGMAGPTKYKPGQWDILRTSADDGTRYNLFIQAFHTRFLVLVQSLAWKLIGK